MMQVNRSEGLNGPEPVRFPHLPGFSSQHFPQPHENWDPHETTVPRYSHKWNPKSLARLGVGFHKNIEGGRLHLAWKIRLGCGSTIHWLPDKYHKIRQQKILPGTHHGTYESTEWLKLKRRSISVPNIFFLMSVAISCHQFAAAHPSVSSSTLLPSYLPLTSRYSPDLPCRWWPRATCRDAAWKETLLAPVACWICISESHVFSYPANVRGEPVQFLYHGGWWTSTCWHPSKLEAAERQKRIRNFWLHHLGVSWTIGVPHLPWT